MSILRSHILIIPVFLAVSFSLAVAQGTYTAIDFPGASRTIAYGINNEGDVVGYYFDSDNSAHGFLLSGGVFTTLDVPGATSTYAFGINDLGQIVGSADSSGFLYDTAAQTFSTFSYSSEHSFTQPYGINNAGTISGCLTLTRPQRSINAGFTLSAGKYQPIQSERLPNTFAFEINNLGQVAGVGSHGGPNFVNFIFAQRKFQLVQVPAVQVSGINDNGVIVGMYYQHDTITAGFILPPGGGPQTLMFPGSGGTVAFGINNAGAVAGWYGDPDGITYHGFIWTPPTDGAPKNRRGAN